MALYWELYDKLTTLNGCRGQWHVGEKVDLEPESFQFASVQADCDELLYIIAKFKNIPFHTDKPVQKWYGDLAKFILANL